MSIIIRKSAKTKRLVLVLILLLLVPSVAAEVVVFSTYNTDITLEKGKLHIERNMRLKNVGGNPIIPGELHFKLKQESSRGVFAPAIENVHASNAYNTELTTTVIRGRTETDLVISVWDPMLPGFHYDLKVSYDLAFEPSGILFYEIAVPVEDTTIPITNNKVRFHIPDSYHVTYAPNATVTTEGSEKIVSWENVDLLEFEYSKLPLPKLGIRAVNMFWVVIIVLLLSMFFVVWWRRR